MTQILQPLKAENISEISRTIHIDAALNRINFEKNRVNKAVETLMGNVDKTKICFHFYLG